MADERRTREEVATDGLIQKARALRSSEAIEWEVYPGATNEIDRLAEESGGWVCERHPWLPFEHDDCPGPGMLGGREWEVDRG